MSFGEMKRMQSDITKSRSESNFDPDKRVEIPQTCETGKEKGYDIDDPVEIPQTRETGKEKGYDIDDPVEIPQTRETGKEKDFDPDDPVKISQARETDKEKSYDANKRVEAPVNKETDAEKAEKPDPVLEQIEQKISTKDGLKELMEKHPEEKELWDRISDAIDTLNDPEASVLEKNNAQRKIDKAKTEKGDILEIAAKDALAEAGLDVESKQRAVEGENGPTFPDVIAHNKTDKPIEALGTVVQPGESLYVECKCGRKGYLNQELKEHIPNQLSGHKEGKSVLLTTSDMKNTQPGLVEEVCDKYNTKLVVSDVSAKQVENTMKEVFGK